MLYLRKSFTLPARDIKTSDKNWDRAFLSESEFKQKYPEERINAIFDKWDGVMQKLADS